MKIIYSNVPIETIYNITDINGREVYIKNYKISYRLKVLCVLLDLCCFFLFFPIANIVIPFIWEAVYILPEAVHILPIDKSQIIAIGLALTWIFFIDYIWLWGYIRRHFRTYKRVKEFTLKADSIVNAIKVEKQIRSFISGKEEQAKGILYGNDVEISVPINNDFTGTQNCRFSLPEEVAEQFARDGILDFSRYDKEWENFTSYNLQYTE